MRARRAGRPPQQRRRTVAKVPDVFLSLRAQQACTDCCVARRSKSADLPETKDNGVQDSSAPAAMPIGTRRRAAAPTARNRPKLSLILVPGRRLGMHAQPAQPLDLDDGAEELGGIAQVAPTTVGRGLLRRLKSSRRELGGQRSSSQTRHDFCSVHRRSISPGAKVPRTRRASTSFAAARASGRIRKNDGTARLRTARATARGNGSNRTSGAAVVSAPQG